MDPISPSSSFKYRRFFLFIVDRIGWLSILAYAALLPFTRVDFFIFEIANLPFRAYMFLMPLIALRILVIKHPRWYREKIERLFILLITWWTFVGVSAVVDNTRTSFFGSAEIVFISVIVVLLPLAVRNFHEVKYITVVFVFAVNVLAMLTLLGTPQYSEVSHRLHGFTGFHQNFSSYISVIAFVILFAVIFSNRTILVRIISLGMAWSFMRVIIYAGSRGSIAVMIVGIILFSVLSRRRLLNVVAICVGSTGILAFIIYLLFSRVSIFSMVEDYFVYYSNRDLSNLNRVLMIKGAWAAAVDSPLVGQGLDFRSLVFNFKNIQTKLVVTHSSYMFFLAATGILGLASFGLVIGWILLTLWRLRLLLKSNIRFNNWVNLNVAISLMWLVRNGFESTFMETFSWGIIGIQLATLTILKEFDAKDHSETPASP